MQTLRYLSCLYNDTNAVFDLWEIDWSSVLMLKWASRWAPIVLQFVILRILKSSSIPKVSLHHRLSPQAIIHDQVKVKKVNAKSNWGCLNFQFSFKDPELTLHLRSRFYLITFKEEWGGHQNIRKHECSKIMWSSFTSNEFERFESGCISCRKRYEEISFSGHFNFNFKLNLIIFVKSQICRHI